MGYAIAWELIQQSAKVILISGPTNLTISNPAIKKVDVLSTHDMHLACLKYFPKCDAAIMSAAVADFTPADKKDQKIKSGGKTKSMDLKLIPTVDIAKDLGKLKKEKQKLIGFALETSNEENNALRKLKSKNLDFIVLNSLNNKGAGFGYDTNKITIIHKDNKKIEFELKSKQKVAVDIVNELMKILELPEELN